MSSIEEAQPVAITLEAISQRMPAGPRVEFHGWPMFPERLRVLALAIDVTTGLLKTLDDFFTESSAEVAAWPGPWDDSLTPATRARLEQIRTRRSTR